MTAPDWPAEPESNPPPAAAASSMATSSDLFDGELFGDELIDIYNAAVGEGANPGSDEIPVVKPMAVDDDHPGALVAATAAAIDDGLGAFRPSTSFNDLTILLPVPGASAGKDDPKQNEPTPTPAEAGAAFAEAPKHSNGAPPKAASVPGTSVPPATSAGGVKRKAITALSASGSKRQAAPVAVARSGVSSLASTANAAATKAKAKPAHKATKTKPKPSVASSNPSAVASARATTTGAASKKAKSSVVPEKAGSASQVPAKAATEADFKNVAQAAVSSLILSTKNGDTTTASKAGTGNELVDTTTAHVKALTGTNWVAACSGAGAAAVAAGGVAAAAADAKSNNRSKRQSLTADERARQNRDRNREHARNTRLRKKAYVEELKRTLTELVAQRDKSELDKRQSAQREVEQREVRFRVIEEFLKLRGRNESTFASWAAILDPKFSLTLPATDFRDLVHGETVTDPNANVKLEKVFAGVPDVMSESNNFASFLQTLGSAAEASEYNSVGFVYSCDRNNFFMDDNHAVLDYSANSMGLTMRGATAELSIRGSIRAVFCPASNKLISANIMFDTGAALSQLQEFMNIPGGASAEAAAAQAAATHVFLDSLQMPQLDNGGVAIVPQGESSDEGS